MTDPRPSPTTVRIKTGDGREVQLTCPICTGKTFITVRAPGSEEGIGFQHVIAGREMRMGRQGPMLTLPVKFWACSNCGYALKFLITKEDADAAVHD
jgi:RNase P subunit RPR2